MQWCMYLIVIAEQVIVLYGRDLISGYKIVLSKITWQIQDTPFLKRRNIVTISILLRTKE